MFESIDRLLLGLVSGVAFGFESVEDSLGSMAACSAIGWPVVTGEGE